MADNATLTQDGQPKQGRKGLHRRRARRAGKPKKPRTDPKPPTKRIPRQPRHRASTQRYWEAASEWCGRTLQPPVKGFFGQRNQYPFSNHAAVSFMYRGMIYPTSEHVYLEKQARHYGLKDFANFIVSGRGTRRVGNRTFHAINPKHIKALSTIEFRPIKRNPRDPRVVSWNAKRDQVMFGIVMAKFRTNTTAFKALMATGNQFLVEASPHDKYWGAGTDADDKQLAHLIHRGTLPGINRLGLILMAVRRACQRVNIGWARTKTRTLKYIARRTAACAKTVPGGDRKAWAEYMTRHPRCFLPRTVQLIQSTIKDTAPSNGWEAPKRSARRYKTGRQRRALTARH